MQAQIAPETPSPWCLLWSVRLSALYHLKRERFLDGMDKTAKAVSAIGGAAAFSQLKDHATFGLWVVGFITLVSTLSLVYGPSAKARRHAELARDYKRLEAEIILVGTVISEAQIAKYDSQRVCLEASEPASLGALTTQCHNELCEAIGDKSQITPIPFWHWFFKNWFDIDQTIKN